MRSSSRGFAKSHPAAASPDGVLGHSQSDTTYRYVNANVETAKRAAAALDGFNAEAFDTMTAPELIHQGLSSAKLRIGETIDRIATKARRVIQSATRITVAGLIIRSGRIFVNFD